ncbi:emp24/gp25L/p24 family/GOLD-domain-containing protein [Yarrowia lipolytica]|uniref:YALI0E34852p n=2 Tax=Yarrowia lipolytica TaxID=4952 RepID=Q6C3H2_YARLI|nr:YALI0E34852p [Yarrowia lipolytica CLIB122]AOW06406.1 hypothetical protein YALI1_E41399g [Yarrowia lipolytica]KAB8282611.1 emp24/gp25L/p24 family/GOLD-domain-containing protein [Yarrowia lipolytica]KAE8172039.1 emp24/gp25L/p24 family/GOLD-domain-containing protein [Yarrowia lipolytica]KAJ8057774.1 emp24/gp25L/p24 family/GOLD-domain-containing protein [Yarrowia lipolytica]QNQ00929.1 Endosomal protein P24B [Yarrowia lipolytica]|eukprot:XP_504790.1 YALI0E34852p [Yarrowia lipolytica CLIB122]
MKFLVCLLVLALASVVSAHNVLLLPWKRQCFYEDVKKGDTLAVSFQVGNRDPQAGGQLAVDFVINDPHGNQVVKQHEVPDGDVQVPIQVPGRYEYCFSNEFSGIGTKDVTFNVHGVIVIDLNQLTDDALDQEIAKLNQVVQEVRNEQSYIVVRERTHRNTAESTNARVKWWNILQLGVVAVNSLFQIYYLKRFFEVKTLV